jgi:ATP-dependent RNA helicase DDX3X
MEGKPQGKYIPPHKRGQVETPSEVPTQSKFEKFLQGSATRSLSDWGKRDRRSGNVDLEAYEEAEKLFSKQFKSSNLNLYEDIPVEVSETFPEMLNFNDCEVHDCLLQNIKRMGYNVPTPVQRFSIPISLNRRDLMSCAQTGSGKTASFLVPTIAKMLSERPPSSPASRSAYPVTCILAPTRELSIQIYEEALKFAHMSGIRIVTVYGGADPKVQSKELSKGADIVVATPGRLIDFINRGRVSLNLVKYLIIDEADMMFDMGFEPQIRTILEAMKENKRETIMCSATFPLSIQDLAAQFMKDYIFLAIGRVGSTVQHITQKLFYVPDDEKQLLLKQILKDLRGLILIFAETKVMADNLNEFLLNIGKKSNTIHGNKTQVERERALNDFKSSKEAILVATDVASRGLDIPNVTNVINFDFPGNILDYTHRIGRTGRIGNDGSAISFVNEKNRNLFKDIYAILCENDQEIPEWLERSHRSDVSSYRRGRNRRYYRNYY